MAIPLAGNTEQLYDVTESTGLATLPKLKYEHVHLTNFSKMRVDLAAEVSCNNYYHNLL